MPIDPAATTTTTTTTPSIPKSPLPHHYPSPNQQQQQQQSLPIRAPNPPHDPHFLYPFASPGARGGGGGFVPKGLGPDHAAGYPPPPLLYSHGGGVRGGMHHLDYLSHALHVTRPLSHVQFPHLAHSPAPAPAPTAAAAAASASPPVKGHTTKGAARSAVSDVNGYKDTSTRERSRDDTFAVVRDRKVRITEDDPPLYALCRSWLRNGAIEESQPQQKDVMKALPKPLPASMVASYMPNKKEDEKDEDDQEEDEESLRHLSTKDLLKRHIKRAKRVRSRLREERLQRIARYRSRLRLLLPPPVEQFRNDTAAGY